MSSSSRRHFCAPLAVAALLLLLVAEVHCASRRSATASLSTSAAATVDGLKQVEGMSRLAREHGATVPRIGVAHIDPMALRALEQSGSYSISIFLIAPDFAFSLMRPAYNTTCKSLGSGQVYDPDLVNLIYPFAMFRNLPSGEYECTVDQAGYYRFSRVISANDTASVVTYMNLVPVTYGMTIVYNAFTSAGMGAGFFPNMTFPRGAFNFRYATALGTNSDKPSDYSYGLSGKLPARMRWSIWFNELQAASSGAYHLSVETAHIDPVPPYFAGYDYGYNFLNGSGGISIFGGYDQQNGFKKYIAPTKVDAKSWYVGSLSVTNPSDGCSTYTWHTVDTYSKVYGVNPDAPAPAGSGELLLNECFDISDDALKCSAKVFEEDAATLTCGAFGDPHVVMFNGTGVTCGRDTAIVLVDNEWFSLTGLTTLVDGASATTIRSVTFTYKGSCNPATVTFNDLGQITASSLPNSPISMRHRVRLSGNNIYVDAVRLRVQVRALEDATGYPTLVFGVSMPSALVATSTGVCAQSCPAGTLVSIDVSGTKRDAAIMAMAEAACETAGLTGSSFEREACLYDVSTTNDDTYAQVASTSKSVNSDVSTQWRNDENFGNTATSLALSTFSVAVAAAAAVLCLM